jgi:hypothetical protein
MPRKRARQTTRLGLQMDLALKLRTAAPFFNRDGKSHEELSCHQRTSKNVLADLTITTPKTTVQTLKMLILQLNHLLMALSPKAFDTRTVDAQIQISKCLAKLYTVAAELRIDPSAMDAPTESELGLDRLTLEELLQLEALLKKAQGLPPEPEAIRSTPDEPTIHAARDQERCAS